MGRKQMFGDRLRELREQKGLTAYALAKAAEIDGISIARYESGAKTPGLEIAAGIAEAMGESLAIFDECAYPPRRKKKSDKKDG